MTKENCIKCGTDFDEPVMRKDLDRLKVEVINCNGWLVPPEIEKSLKKLCEKHNALIEYLSTDV